MFRIARGSTNWVLFPLTLAIVMAGVGPWFGWDFLVPLSGIPFFLFTLFLWFFRDPNRPVGTQMVSPADGRVLWMDEVDDPDIGLADRLSIFMGVQDVHVNRMPLAGDIRRVTHRPGRHVPAFNKDSERNERVETIVKTDLGDVKIIQIAGAVARRIYPYIEPGDHLHKGDRMGLIRLGSRCDLLLPRGKADWVVQPKQKVRAGVTSISRMEEP